MHVDLGRGQADAVGGVHGFEHVGDELLELGVEHAAPARRACAGGGREIRVMDKYGHGFHLGAGNCGQIGESQPRRDLECGLLYVGKPVRVQTIFANLRPVARG